MTWLYPLVFHLFVQPALSIYIKYLLFGFVWQSVMNHACSGHCLCDGMLCTVSDLCQHFVSTQKLLFYTMLCRAKIWTLAFVFICALYESFYLLYIYKYVCNIYLHTQSKIQEAYAYLYLYSCWNRVTMCFVTHMTNIRWIQTHSMCKYRSIECAFLAYKLLLFHF